MENTNTLTATLNEVAQIENNRRKLEIAPFLHFCNTLSCEISELSLEDFENLLLDCKKAKSEFDENQKKHHNINN